MSSRLLEDRAETEPESPEPGSRCARKDFVQACLEHSTPAESSDLLSSATKFSRC